MALIICSECGKQYSDNAMACPNCANPTHPVSTPVQPQYQAQPQFQAQPQYSYAVPNQMNFPMTSQYTEKLATREQTSGIIWAVIASLQAIIGVCGLWFTLLAAIVNGFAAYASFQKAKKVRNPYPGMVAEYDKQLKNFIFLLIYNVIFGGVFGVIGNIYDLMTRNYVLTNRAVFDGLAAENEKNADAEAQAAGKVRLTVHYTCSAGAATAIPFTIDGQPEKYVVTNAAPLTVYVQPGVHRITIKYNFKTFPFQFDVHGNSSISFCGNMKDVKLNKA